jgi:hypothetical protein
MVFQYACALYETTPAVDENTDPQAACAKWLNTAGDEGWELVAVLPGREPWQIQFFFKRPNRTRSVLRSLARARELRPAVVRPKPAKRPKSEPRKKG